MSFAVIGSSAPRRVRTARLLAATALAGFASLAVPLLAPGAVSSALADGGRGGNGSDNWGLGGAGGTNGQPGTAGGTGQFGNGGGGGGGGGFGGEHGSTQSVLSGVVSGDNGGTGGNGGSATGGNGGGGGGGGGAGGYGAVVSAAGSNTGTVTGGQGGQGGVGGASNGVAGGNGGYGGDGGIGIQVTAPGTTFINSGTIAGGNGGVAGLGGAGTFTGSSGMAGIGGIGMTGASLTIDNTGGTISGGFANGGVGAQARGVHFTGGVNAIGGGTVNGDILVTNSSSFAPTLSTSAIGTGSPVVNGSLVFSPGTQYVIRVSPAASDTLTVTGNASMFAARVNAQFEPGTYVSRQYTILTATSGLNGSTFAGLDSNNLPANTNASLSYSATNVFLNLALNFTTPGGSLNTNQQNVANALTNYFNSTGGIPAEFASLNGEQLSQAAGETAVGSQQTTFMAMNMFMGLLGDQTINGRGEGRAAAALPYADPSMSYASTRKRSGALSAIDRKVPLKATPFESRWSVWAAGFGGSQTTDGNAALGSSNTTSRAYGVAAGADYRFTPDTIAGFALAGGGTNFSVGNVGSGRSDLFQAGGFVRHTMGPAYVSAALAYGWQDVTTERAVGADRLQGRFNANAFSGRLEGGYRLATAGLGITPYAAAQFTTFALPSYGETALSGTSTFALNFASKSVTATRTELGVRTDKSFAINDAVLTLRGRAAWAHDTNNDRTVAATFQALPGASFVTNGASQAPDAALLSASAEVNFRNSWTVAATFDGEFASTSTSYAGRGVVRYGW